MGQCSGLDSCTGKVAGLTPEPNLSKRKLLTGREAKKNKWFSYYIFGYGIELNLDFLEANDIEYLSYKRAILEDFQIIPNIYTNFKPDPCSLNIIPSDFNQAKNNYNCVHGILLELNRKNLLLLSNLMNLYTQIRVSVQVYEEDGGEVCNEALTYIFTEKRSKELTLMDDILFVGKIKRNYVSENYFKIIINGAKKLDIDKSYINMLEKYIEYKKYDPVESDDHYYNKTLFTWKDVKESNNNLCVLKGFVINWKGFKKYKGQDLTYMYAKQWHGANSENVKSYSKFENEQKEYITNMTLAYFEKPLNKYTNIVGLLKDDNDKEASWDYIEW